MLKKLSYVLIVIGTIGASICAARTNPDAEDWQSIWQIHTPMFLFYIMMIIVGVLFKRIKANPLLDYNPETSNETAAILEHLSQAHTRLKELNTKVKPLSTNEIYQSIGTIIEETIEPFVSGREQIIELYGMAKYALVYTPFAQAERYLNRSWSAAVDGYKDESVEYLSRSLPLLQETHDILKRLFHPNDLKTK